MRTLLALLLCAASACEQLDQPAEPAWNKQACGHCHMLLSDPSTAAQIVNDRGERVFFDDVGCLAAYLADRPRAAHRAWVHLGSQWRQARAARYAAGASTPMGYGFVPRAGGALDFAAVEQAVTARRSAAGELP
jgi:hypothetical protein